MVASSLLLREYPTAEPVDGSAYPIHPTMAVVCEFNPSRVAPLTNIMVVVILALTLCLLLWALWEALSHLWRIRFRQRFFPAIEENTRPASLSTSTTASSPAPGTPRDIEKGITTSGKPPNQLELTNTPRIMQDVELTSKTPGAHLTKTSLLGVHIGPKIFLAGPVSDEDFVIPPRSRTSDDGDIIPTLPPNGLFITNPSPPTDADDVPEHFEDVALNTSGTSHRQINHVTDTGTL